MSTLLVGAGVGEGLGAGVKKSAWFCSKATSKSAYAYASYACMHADMAAAAHSVTTHNYKTKHHLVGHNPTLRIPKRHNYDILHGLGARRPRLSCKYQA